MLPRQIFSVLSKIRSWELSERTDNKRLGFATFWSRVSTLRRPVWFDVSHLTPEMKNIIHRVCLSVVLMES